jgi:acetate---CoA ligase (ADP-forming)
MDEETVKRFTNLDPEFQFAVVASRGRGEGSASSASPATNATPTTSPTPSSPRWSRTRAGRGIGTALVRQVALGRRGRRHHPPVRRHPRRQRADAEPGARTRPRVPVGHDGRRRPLRPRGIASPTASSTSSTARSGPRRGGAQALLPPGAVAVVGASRNPLAIGGLVFDNLLRGGFEGVVYPVNPNAPHVQGPCPPTPRCGTARGARPGDRVRAGTHWSTHVIDEAGELGVAAVCVITAGFAEIGEEGRAPGDLLAKARGTGCG